MIKKEGRERGKERGREEENREGTIYLGFYSRKQETFQRQTSNVWKKLSEWGKPYTNIEV